MTSIAATPPAFSKDRGRSLIADGRRRALRSTVVTVAIAVGLIALLLVVSVVLGPTPPASMETIHPLPGFAL